MARELGTVDFFDRVVDVTVKHYYFCVGLPVHS
jgi:hypothetical protein